MVIPKCANFDSGAWCARILVVWLALGAAAYGEYSCGKGCDGPAGSEMRTPAVDHEREISILRKRALACKEPVKADRIQYGIGVLQFKAGDFAGALKEFKTLASKEACPIMEKVFALNMAGQIYRLMGDSQRCLDAFSEAIRAVEGNRENTRENAAALQFVECSAKFARAETFEARKDDQSALTEYEGIITFLSTYAANGPLREYLPLARDRAAGLYWARGERKRYQEHTDAILRNHREYARWPLVKLERACVAFAEKNQLPVDCSMGISIVPAKVLGYVREKKILATELAGDLKALCEEGCRSRYAGVIGYAYAILLDAMGKAEESRRVLASVCDSSQVQVSGGAKAGDFMDVGAYARIQHAITLGEQGRYRSALQQVRQVATVPQNPHIAKITEAVERNLDTLEKQGGYEEEDRK